MHGYRCVPGSPLNKRCPEMTIDTPYIRPWLEEGRVWKGDVQCMRVKEVCKFKCQIFQESLDVKPRPTNVQS